MAMAKMNVMTVLVVITLFGGQYLIWGVQSNMAALQEDFCLNLCIKGRKTTGISPLRCFKYCEKHCDPPPASSAQKSSPGLHYCKLGCMLDKCAQFRDDQRKEESCVSDCENNVCLIG